VPCLALGWKLSEAGVIDSADDIVYLRLSEIEEAAANPDTGDWRRLVAQRRAERDRWMKVVPPVTIGAPPTDLAEGIASGIGRFSGLGADIGADERVLRGSAASIGVVQARAKVVLSLDDVDKLERGDILVCRTTSPSWTPLFTRVAAVVADAGGVLAHCGIVAREYAIPCVVGVGVATQRISDGMLITVDGGQGIVRLDD